MSKNYTYEFTPLRCLQMNEYGRSAHEYSLMRLGIYPFTKLISHNLIDELRSLRQKSQKLLCFCDMLPIKRKKILDLPFSFYVRSVCSLVSYVILKCCCGKTCHDSIPM